MDTIYWYKKPNGEIIDLSTEHAWRVHKQYTSRGMGYTYLGCSDGRFLKALKAQNRPEKDEKTGMFHDFPEETKVKIREAMAQEIELAKTNLTPPPDQSRKEFSGLQGGMRPVFTPGINDQLR